MFIAEGNNNTYFITLSADFLAALDFFELPLCFSIHVFARIPCPTGLTFHNLISSP